MCVCKYVWLLLPGDNWPGTAVQTLGREILLPAAAMYLYIFYADSPLGFVPEWIRPRVGSSGGKVLETREIYIHIYTYYYCHYYYYTRERRTSFRVIIIFLHLSRLSSVFKIRFLTPASSTVYADIRRVSFPPCLFTERSLFSFQSYI